MSHARRRRHQPSRKSPRQQNRPCCETWCETCCETCCETTNTPAMTAAVPWRRYSAGNGGIVHDIMAMLAMSVPRLEPGLTSVENLALNTMQLIIGLILCVSLFTLLFLTIAVPLRIIAALLN